MDSIKIDGDQIVKLPFQHRLFKMVLSNLAGFIISEAIGTGYEKYMLTRLNKTIQVKENPANSDGNS